jgi:asparagine synthase (glutamine-hydrolysing)
VQKILASSWLPPELDVQRKQGFSIPFEAWLRAAGDKGLSGCFSHLPECIDRGELQRLIKGLERGRSNGARLFALMLLSISARNLVAN